jgi:hypothetical protein
MSPVVEIPRAAQPRAHNRHWWIAPLSAAVLVYLVLALWLAYTKAPWCDEGWFANPAYNLAFHGNTGSNLLEPSGHFLNAYLRGIQQRTYIAMPTHIVALAGWFRMFGPSVFSARLYSICWGAITLPILFYILQKLFPDRRVAIFGTALTAIDFIFLWTTADVRMEATANALALASLAAYLHFRERHFQKAVIWSQALGAAAVFNHPNAVLVVLAIVILAWREDRERLRERPWRYLACTAAPYLLFAAIWLVYILQSPADFKAQFLANAAGHKSERLTLLIHPNVALWAEIVRHVTAYYISTQWSGAMQGWMAVIPFLYLPAVVWFLRTARHAESRAKTFAVFFVVMLLGITFVNGFKARNYLISVTPLYDALLAAWLLDLWRRRIDAKCVAALVGALFVALQLSITALHIRADEFQRYYQPAIEDLARYRAAGKTIDATSALGFGLDFNGFTDDARMGMYTGRTPDVLVIDRSYRNFAMSFAEDEPEVFDHIVSTITMRYRFVAQHGPFWIFERAHPPVDGSKLVPWMNAGNLKSVGVRQRSTYFFQRVFLACRMRDPEISAF